MLKEIKGMRKASPEELETLEKFHKQMEEVVIPEIIECDFQNRVRAAESRKCVIF